MRELNLTTVDFQNIRVLDPSLALIISTKEAEIAERV
jgi:hypothetical protein